MLIAGSSWELWIQRKSKKKVASYSKVTFVASCVQRSEQGQVELPALFKTPRDAFKWHEQFGTVFTRRQG